LVVCDCGEQVVATCRDRQLRRVGDLRDRGLALADACLGGEQVGREALVDERLGVRRVLGGGSRAPPGGPIDAAAEVALVAEGQPREAGLK
jgi:hypothetical protein